MTDRIRTPAPLPAIAAALVLLAASSAWTQAQAQPTATTAPKELPKRHLDVEAGVGVHFALENDVPIDDDVYAVLGFAAPITDHFDGEFQAAYWSASENERTLDPLVDPDPDSSLDGWHFNAGFRYYPFTEPDSTARFYLAGGASLLLDYREDDNEVFAANIGPGVRMRAGQQSGMLVRVPVLIMLEGEADPIMVPTFNLFYQF